MTLFSVTCAFAGTEPAPLSQGLRPHRLSGSVQMTSELVTIELGTEVCQVRARYQFSNHSESTEILKMGLPSKRPGEILHPKVRVDSMFVPTRTSKKERLVIEDNGEYEFSRILTTHWLVWTLECEPGTTHTVEMSYAVVPIANTDGTDTPYTLQKNDIIEEFTNKGWKITQETQAVLKSILSLSTGYVLQAGAGWGQAIATTLEVKHPMGKNVLRGLEKMSHAHATPLGAQWDFANLEPEFDLVVEYNPEISIEKELTQVKAALKRHPQSKSLAALEAFLKKRETF